MDPNIVRERLDGDDLLEEAAAIFLAGELAAEQAAAATKIKRSWREFVTPDQELRFDQIMHQVDHGPAEPGPEAEEHFDRWVDFLAGRFAVEYKEPPRAEFPTACLAGSRGKVQVLKERALRGQSLWHPLDCPEQIDVGAPAGRGRNGQAFRRPGLESLIAQLRHFRSTV